MIAPIRFGSGGNYSSCKEYAKDLADDSFGAASVDNALAIVASMLLGLYERETPEEMEAFEKSMAILGLSMIMEVLVERKQNEIT